MNNLEKNHEPNKSTSVINRIFRFCKENKKEIGQLMIIGIILFFIYIFVFYMDEIRQGFMEGWNGTE